MFLSQIKLNLMKRKNIEYIMATNLCQFSIISFDICRFKHLCVSSIVNAQHGVGINCFSPRLNNMSYKNQQRNKTYFLLLTFLEVLSIRNHNCRWNKMSHVEVKYTIDTHILNSIRTHNQCFIHIKKKKQLFNKYMRRLVNHAHWREVFIHLVVTKDCIHINTHILR